MEELQAYYDGLTKFEKNFLATYSSGGVYEAFNRAMREGQQLTKKESELKYAFLSIFAHAPPLKEDITVYRGVKMDEKAFKKAMFKVQTSFTSTSISKEVATKPHFKSNCCLMTLTIPKGSRVLYYHQAPHYEHEVILPPGFNWNLKVDPSNKLHYTGVYTPYDPYMIKSLCTYQDLDLMNLLSETTKEVLYAVAIHCVEHSVGNVTLASNILGAAWK